MRADTHPAPPPPSQEGWYLSETETVLELIFGTLLTATMCVGVQVLGGDFHPLELTYMYSSSPIALAL